MECRLAPVVAQPLVDVSARKGKPNFLPVHSRRIVVLCKPKALAQSKEGKSTITAFTHSSALPTAPSARAHMGPAETTTGTGRSNPSAALASSTVLPKRAEGSSTSVSTTGGAPAPKKAKSSAASRTAAEHDVAPGPCDAQRIRAITKSELKRYVNKAMPALKGLCPPLRLHFDMKLCRCI